MKKIDLTGQIFGKLTVLEFYETDKNGQKTWVCQCSCVNKTITVVTGGWKWNQ